jgi:hypothetical protein
MTFPHTPPPGPLTAEEWDRLADYLAEALDPADAAQVAQLISTDPRWADAYEELTRADALVRSQLSALADVPEPLPADVLARLDTALATTIRADADADVITLPAQRGGGRARAGRVGEGRRRGSRVRRFAGVVVGAAAAVVGVTFAVNITTQLTDTTVSSPAMDRGEAVAPVTPGFAAVNPVVVASGTDYTFESLTTLGRGSLSTAAPAPGNDDQGPLPPAVVSSPGPYANVGTNVGLASCLGLVLGAYPGTATLVDYARFEGTPALVILIRQATGRVAVVAGPNCGAGDADVRAVVAVP